MVLSLHSVLYKGMPPASRLLLSFPSLLGHSTWLALQQYNLPGATILMSMVWVVAMVVPRTILSIFDLRNSSVHLQYVYLHHS